VNKIALKLFIVCDTLCLKKAENVLQHYAVRRWVFETQVTIKQRKVSYDKTMCTT